MKVKHSTANQIKSINKQLNKTSIQAKPLEITKVNILVYQL
jgi:hypothetical protein